VTWAGRIALVVGALAVAVLALLVVDDRGGRVALAVALLGLGALLVWFGRSREAP
jgi:hypothetical protein